MILKIFVVVLFLFLGISVAINFIFFKKQDYRISFEKVDSQTLTHALTPTSPLTPTPTQSITQRGELNKKITISIEDYSDGEVTEVEYTLTDYEITNEIVVKGKRATTIAGRVFLIINIQMVNSHNEIIEVNTRDYVRLSVNKNDTWIAPDIHTDPVQVQPVSTKLTRVGFPINDTDKDFSLQLGEEGGEKEIINF